MTLQPTPSRTVTPMPGSYVAGGCDASGEPLTWASKNPSATDDYWLDATLEVADSGANVLQFAYDVYYTDDVLTVVSQTTDGNKCGLLLSGGTSGLWYAIRILATLADGRKLTWNVALPMNNEASDTVITDTVLLNGAALSYAGRTLPA